MIEIASHILVIHLDQCRADCLSVYHNGQVKTPALEVLEKWDDNLSLLMVGFVKPHHPFDPPAPWDGLYNPEETEQAPYLDYDAPARLTRSRGYRKNRINYYEDTFNRKEKEYGM